MSTYACADLHGVWDLWEQIKKFCKEDDTICVLGDCVDRGPDGFAILKDVMQDPRVILLCGNHEDMMADALEEERLYGHYDYEFYRWFSNGGHLTYEAWNEDGRDFGWIERIRALPLSTSYVNKDGINVLMCHSGVTPKAGWDMDSCGRHALLWDRSQLGTVKWHRAENEVIVYGHTPIELMPQFNSKNIEIPVGAFWHCDDHKINIDNGAYWNRKACLLDLDTFDEHIFEV